MTIFNNCFGKFYIGTYHLDKNSIKLKLLDYIYLNLKILMTQLIKFINIEYIINFSQHLILLKIILSNISTVCLKKIPKINLNEILINILT